MSSIVASTTTGAFSRSVAAKDNPVAKSPVFHALPTMDAVVRGPVA